MNRDHLALVLLLLAASCAPAPSTDPVDASGREGAPTLTSQAGGDPATSALAPSASTATAEPQPWTEAEDAVKKSGALDVDTKAPDAVKRLTEAVAVCGDSPRMRLCSTPTYAVLYAKLGGALLVSENKTEASRAFFTARSMDPDSFSKLDPAAAAYAKLNNANPASVSIGTIRVLDPSKTSAADDRGAGAPADSPEEARIRAAVEKHEGSFLGCFAPHLAANKSLIGQLELQFLVGADGQTGKVSSEGDLPVPEAFDCVARIVSRIPMPPPLAEKRISIRMLFQEEP